MRTSDRMMFCDLGEEEALVVRGQVASDKGLGVGIPSDVRKWHDCQLSYQDFEQCFRHIDEIVFVARFNNATVNQTTLFMIGACAAAHLKTYLYYIVDEDMAESAAVDFDRLESARQGEHFRAKRISSVEELFDPLYEDMQVERSMATAH